MYFLYLSVVVIIYNISLIGAGVGIGIVFGSLIVGATLNPDVVIKFFSYAVLRFTLTWSVKIFKLLVFVLFLSKKYIGVYFCCWGGVYGSL